MKDKRKDQFTINDLVKKHKAEAPPKRNYTPDELEDEFVEEAPIVSQEELNAIYEYNSNIVNLDADYANVTPMSKILVRLFLHEPNKTENGLLEPYKQLIPVQTNSGVGSLYHIESPFPYSNKAVIVAVPLGYTSIKPGDIVQLESNPIKPVSNGHGANATVSIPHAYMHTSAPSLEIPRDPTNKHYGYLLLPFHEISVKIA